MFADVLPLPQGLSRPCRPESHIPPVQREPRPSPRTPQGGLEKHSCIVDNFGHEKCQNLHVQKISTKQIVGHCE